MEVDSTKLPTPESDHPTLYENYEVRNSDEQVLFGPGPLWAAFIYLKLETSQTRRRLVSVK